MIFNIYFIFSLWLPGGQETRRVLPGEGRHCQLWVREALGVLHLRRGQEGHGAAHGQEQEGLRQGAHRQVVNGWVSHDHESSHRLANRPFLRDKEMIESFWGYTLLVKWPEIIGSLKLGNVWVFLQLIYRQLRTKNQLYLNPNIS